MSEKKPMFVVSLVPLIHLSRTKAVFFIHTVDAFEQNQGELSVMSGLRVLHAVVPDAIFTPRPGIFYSLFTRTFVEAVRSTQVSFYLNTVATISAYFGSDTLCTHFSNPIQLAASASYFISLLE